MKQMENNIILMVFPGLGKTTAAKNLPNLADCDYGYYRSSWPSRYDKSCLLSFCQKVINIYSKEGFIVLTNEPKLLPWIKQNGRPIVMVLPKDGIDLGKRILVRELEHPVNTLWAREYATKWKQWVEGWKAVAKHYSIPIIEVEYLYQDWPILISSLHNLGYIKNAEVNEIISLFNHNSY